MSIIRRIVSLFRSGKMEQDLEDELRSHLEMRAEDSIDSGLHEREAQTDARRRLGNELRLREEMREIHTWHWLETVLQDIRYGLRTPAAWT
jgi:hypothetical protein